jgi:hypothetical protein
MTTRGNLPNALQLSAELDQVTVAIALVNTGNYRVAIEISADDHAAMRFNANNIPQQTLLNQLTARQTALQNALTALGVT